MNTRSDKIRNRRKKKKRKTLVLIMFPILLIVFSAVSYGGYLFSKASDVAAGSQEELSRGEQSQRRMAAVDPSKDSISILIMGVDESDTRDDFGDAIRTDALILATFNVKDKSVKMVSIPRDSYVYIPERGKKDKITHAHAYGGTEATIETVEELFDIPVDYFFKLNFKAFIDVVDALGGIMVDVPITVSEMDSNDNKNAIHLEKGFQKLNGEEALALARTRKIDNDIERGKRQQLVVKAMIDKAISVGSVTKYGDVMESMGNNLSTNMDFSEMLGLFNYALSGLDIESLELEGADDRINNIYYYQLEDSSIEEIEHTLKVHLDLAENIANNAIEGDYKLN